MCEGPWLMHSGLNEHFASAEVLKSSEVLSGVLLKLTPLWRFTPLTTFTSHLFVLGVPLPSLQSFPVKCSGVRCRILWGRGGGLFMSVSRCQRGSCHTVGKVARKQLTSTQGPKYFRFQKEKKTKQGV